MAVGPFSLAGYRPLGRRKPSTRSQPEFPRPDAPVAWLHATSDLRAAALADLADRLKAQRPDIPILLTFDRRHLTGPLTGSCDGSHVVLPLDADFPAAANEFLAHWRPAVCLWTGLQMMRSLLRAAQSAGVPMILADAVETDLVRDGPGWLPDRLRPILQGFDQIFAVDLATSARLQRQGVAHTRIQVAPNLQDSMMPPACDESDLTAAGEALAGRSVWLAACLRAQEVSTLLAAHRHAVRLAHRLLLVVTPATDQDGAVLRQQLQASGLRWEDWQPGDAIDEFVQVLVADDPASLPLWFRLAPVCLMGGTLAPDGRAGPHPFLAAGLGSAILHGPHLGTHGPAYRRLTTAGGARLVTGGQPMAEAVLQLAMPEQAAAMALAGWEAVTQGAWLTDQLIEMVQDRYDTNDDAHARP